jgi:hypothetical protein
MGCKSRRKAEGKKFPIWSASEIDAAVETFLPGTAAGIEAVLRTTIQAIGSSKRFWQVFYRLTPAQRVATLLMWRDGTRHLADRKKCDFCDCEAANLRFLVMTGKDMKCGKWKEEGSQGMLVAAICPDHARSSDGALISLAVKEAARLAIGPDRCVYNSVVPGALVGHAANLSADRALATCKTCGADMWISQTYHESTEQGGLPVRTLCATCFAAGLQNGSVVALFDYRGTDPDWEAS